MHRHFTDHSIVHCDRVATAAEQLQVPLRKKLSDDEAFVLYGGCYLHDIGMHYEMAGLSGRLADVLKDRGTSWTNIPDEERLELIRRHHHEISADMVMASVKHGEPPINFTLSEQDRPREIAALCEGHCVDTESERYERLVGTLDRPSMRLRLLSAILRLADVVDESHHRALVEQSRLLDLDLESRMHWWRHYFTREIELDAEKNRITVSYAFPTAKRDQYAKLVPALHLPWVEMELLRHRAVLAPNGLSWHLASGVQESPFDVTEEMPPDVESFMLQEISKRTQITAQRSRVDLLKHFDTSRAQLMEQVRAVEAGAETTDPIEYLTRMIQLTDDLWRLGSRLTAQTTLGSALFFATTNGRSVPAVLHLRAATDLARMRADREPRSSVETLARVQAVAEQLDDGANEKVAYYCLLASLCLRVGALEDGSAAAREAIRLLGNCVDGERVKAEVAEATFLGGRNPHE